jgi:hypothetical protein
MIIYCDQFENDLLQKIVKKKPLKKMLWCCKLMCLHTKHHNAHVRFFGLPCMIMCEYADGRTGRTAELAHILVYLEVERHAQTELYASQLWPDLRPPDWRPPNQNGLTVTGPKRTEG